MRYQHLTLEERSMIAPMRILGWSIREIAIQLGRAPSTISRELRRNSDGTGAYAGYWAHRDAQRRRRAGRHSCLTSGELARYVRERKKRGRESLCECTAVSGVSRSDVPCYLTFPETGA
jgi:transposase, IS30 family